MCCTLSNVEIPPSLFKEKLPPKEHSHKGTAGRFEEGVFHWETSLETPCRCFIIILGNSGRSWAHLLLQQTPPATALRYESFHLFPNNAQPALHFPAQITPYVLRCPEIHFGVDFFINAAFDNIIYRMMLWLWGQDSEPLWVLSSFPHLEHFFLQNPNRIFSQGL